jgi:hypothetical protein
MSNSNTGANLQSTTPQLAAPSLLVAAIPPLVGNHITPLKLKELAVFEHRRGDMKSPNSNSVISSCSCNHGADSAALDQMMRAEPRPRTPSSRKMP